MKLLVNSNNKAFLSNGKVLAIDEGITPLTVTPTTSQQTITASGGVKGYSPITVSAVTSSIDSNITAENIKKDVTILGVTGTLESSGSSGKARPFTANYWVDTDGFVHNIGEDSDGQAISGSQILSATATTIGNGINYIDTYNSNNKVHFVDLSNLISISGNDTLAEMFHTCPNLVNVDLSNLISISGNAPLAVMVAQTAIESFEFSSLTTLSSENALLAMFFNTPIKTLSFPSLTSTSFGSYTNQFYDMLSQVTGCTVHFPSNLQSVIGSWSDVTSGFGGTNTTVLFDLPATT